LMLGRWDFWGMPSASEGENEECFGWLKDIALLRELRLRGLPTVGWALADARLSCELLCPAACPSFDEANS
jgi:hypothetical protein